MTKSDDPDQAGPKSKAASAASKAASGGGNGGPPRPPISFWDAFWRAVSSGLFFMVVGCLFLIVAANTMGQTHSSLSFVLVVVGIAILLYGTGTQGMGQLDSHLGAAKYKVAVAGGAGVLAFCVAFGILWKAEDIKAAFQIEKKYVRVRIEPDNSDGVTATLFADYVPDVSLNGESMPVVRRGNAIEVYVYYFANKNRTASLSVDLYVRAEAKSPLAKSHAFDQYTLALNNNNLDVSDGSLDFPLYRETFKIALQSEEGQKIKGAELDSRELDSRYVPDKSGVPMEPALFPVVK